MIGEDRQPGIESPSSSESELIEAELMTPEVEEVEATLSEAYDRRREAGRLERDAGRHEREAGRHERAAEDDRRRAGRLEDEADDAQRRAGSGDAVTAEADVVEVDGLELTGERQPPLADAERDATGAEVVHLEEAIDALPALARVAAGAWLRAAAWGVGTSLRTGVRVARAATDPAAAADLYQEVTDGLRAYAREFLGISDLDERVRQLTPLAGSTLPRNGHRPEIDLRARGEELLRHAADVDYEDAAHPAYARILSEISPDEARILRLLAVEGPQPVVDVRAQNLIGLGSQLVMPGLNMIASQAGVRARERVPAYLNNLGRLGLIYVADEALEDPIAYQVLEAQPEVLSVIKETSRAKTVHRSVRLTPFGVDFTAVCLPIDAPAPTEEVPPPIGGERAGGPAGPTRRPPSAARRRPPGADSGDRERR